MTRSEIFSGRPRPPRFVAGSLFVLLLAGCVGDAGWRSLDSLADLQKDFNEDAGTFRVILLLSPT